MRLVAYAGVSYLLWRKPHDPHGTDPDLGLGGPGHRRVLQSNPPTRKLLLRLCLPVAE